MVALTAIDILDLKEFTSGTMNYGVKVEHPSWRIITAKGVTFLLSMYVCLSKASMLYGAILNCNHKVVILNYLGY